jgi:hypothetical protein
MHIPKNFTLRFDPDASDDLLIRQIFQNNAAKVLWCAIKSSHVTDQYFNKITLDVSASFYSAVNPCDYREFLVLTARLNNVYGRICVYETIIHKQFEIDHEFWSDILKAITGKLSFVIEINPPKTDTQRG